MVRKNGGIGEVAKAKMIEELTKEAAEAYAEIITRYPAMDRALDAKARLEALHQPVPRPTRAALEQNKKEMASRHEASIMASMLGNFEKHPDVAKAAHVGEPTMVDPEPVTATRVVQQIDRRLRWAASNKVSAETMNGTVAPNQEAPRSDAPAAATIRGRQRLRKLQSGAGPAAAELSRAVADPNELKPNVEPDPNALPPLQQSNRTGERWNVESALRGAPPKTEEMADISSSKKKKKKGLKKLNPF